jgi:hypothetical protein
VQNRGVFGRLAVEGRGIDFDGIEALVFEEVSYGGDGELAVAVSLNRILPCVPAGTVDAGCRWIQRPRLSSFRYWLLLK